MKKSILIASFFFGTFAFAQTAEQRAVIQQSIDKIELTLLKTKFENDFQLQQQRISKYISVNKSTQRTFTKNGSLYMLHRIDDQGNPVYINTKDINQVNNAKANSLYSGGSVGVNITGTNMVAGIWDGGQVNANHELLSGRATMQPNQTKDTITGNNHMQAVTGIMVGKILPSGGNQGAVSARGIAPDATSQNFDWINDLTEMAGFAGNGYLISNHSYGNSNAVGTPIYEFGAYDADAKAWDTLLKTTPNYLAFVAAGNEQQTNGNTGANGFDIISGSSAAKNVMTVGAIELNNIMSDYSNWGPTDDGRVKPDIVTLGSNINAPLYTGNTSYTGAVASSSGTSYSAPATAAAGLLLQQYYFSIFGKYMLASSLKALMLHTADDAGNPGPDAKFGWGILNVERAAQTIKQMQTGGSASLGEVSVTVTAGNTAFTSGKLSASGVVRGSICWSDDDGPVQTAGDGVNNTSTRLVYDFNPLLRVQSNTFFAQNRPYKNLNVLNPNANATIETQDFDGAGNNYKQCNVLNAPDGAGVTFYYQKKSTAPATAKMVSFLITGLKATNVTLAANENNKETTTLFYSKEDNMIKMISNNARIGFGNYKIYDMSGKLLNSGTEKSSEISFQNSNSGLYILVYDNAGKQETFKFRK